MTDAGFYKGTSSEQDSRFMDKQRKLLKQMRFESNLDAKVNIAKVNLDVLKPWITNKLNEILGLEDDVVIEYVFSQLEEKNIDPKVMQINLTGFLNAKRAREFMGELWALLVEANEADDGIPATLVKLKLLEMKAGGGTAAVAATNAPTAAEAQRGDRNHGERDGGDRDRPRQPQNASSDNDWRHRYESLSRGRFSGPNAVPLGREREGGDRNRPGRDAGNDRPTNDRRRNEDGSPPNRRREFDERKAVGDRERGGGGDRGLKRDRSRSRSRSPPARRRFTEEKGSGGDRNRRREPPSRDQRNSDRRPPPPVIEDKDDDRRRRNDREKERPEPPPNASDSEEEKPKKKKKRSRKSSESEEVRRLAKKHKKEKKEKRKKKLEGGGGSGSD